MTKGTLSLFEIQASEPQKLVEFYSKLFGWTFNLEMKEPVEYWGIKTPGINGGLVTRPAKTPDHEQGTNAFTCSFEVDNYDQAEKLILSMGGIVAMDKFAIPGKRWQGYYVDPDHNTFGIFEVDEKAGLQ